jgi:hypothetical protein
MAGFDKVNWLNDPIDADSLGLGSIFGLPPARNALAPSSGLFGLAPSRAPAPNILESLLGSLSANVGGPCRLRPGLLLSQDPNDLLLGKPAALHRRPPS